MRVIVVVTCTSVSRVICTLYRVCTACTLQRCLQPTDSLLPPRPPHALTHSALCPAAKNVRDTHFN